MTEPLAFLNGRLLPQSQAQLGLNDGGFVYGATVPDPSRTVRQPPYRWADPHIKQRSRMHGWLAEQEVRRTHPGSQALLLDADGCVTETASANFLLVKAGTIVSPPRDTVLEGVSLQVVTELCARLGIAVE